MFVGQSLFLNQELKKLFMAAKKTITHPNPEQFENYKKLVETFQDIELKGDTMPYTSLNGHMFSYLDKEGKMALKLPKTELEAFIEKYKTGFHQAYGIVQKDYATVPDSLLEKTNELHKYLEISYEYTKTLKPKPTKKK